MAQNARARVSGEHPCGSRSAREPHPYDGPMRSHHAPPVQTRLRLAHGCLEHLARGAGVRLLHVKGEALDPQLGANRYISSDCDVLVHPRDVSRYTRILIENGWERRTQFEHGSVFGHAATYYSPVWGTVDLHRCFPGLDRDPAATFEALWSAHTERLMGGVRCPVPSLTKQRLLLLVHAARDSSGRRHHDLQVSWNEVADEEHRRLDALADELGATVPLAIVTGRPERATGLPGERTWRAVHADLNPTEVWKARLSDARREPLRFARLLLSATRVNPDHLALRLGHPPSAEEMRHEWWRRCGRGRRRLLASLRRRSPRS